MRFSILASGSTGNSLYIETDEHAFLVDAGMSGKKMEALLASIDRSMKQIDGIFVTHEHSDDAFLLMQPVRLSHPSR